MSEINIAYFDTVPVAQSLVILKTGFLFVASEFGNHALYQARPLPPITTDARPPPRPALGFSLLLYSGIPVAVWLRA